MRKNWEEEEQKMLKELVEVKSYTWHQISQTLNQIFSMKERTAKQCRQRYNDYICFAGEKQSTKNWGRYETSLLLEKIWKFGISWTKINESLMEEDQPIRVGSNTLKNYYYSSLKMIMNKINHDLKLSRKDSIKWTPFRRFISVGLSEFAQNDSSSSLNQLIKKLIQCSITRIGDMSLEEKECICNELYCFNKNNRHLNARKLLSSRGEKFRNLKLGMEKSLIDEKIEETQKNEEEEGEGEQEEEEEAEQLESTDHLQKLQNLNEKIENSATSKNIQNIDYFFSDDFLLGQKSPQDLFIDSVLSL